MKPYTLVAQTWIPIHYGQWKVRTVTYTVKVEIEYGYPDIVFLPPF